MTHYLTKLLLWATFTALAVQAASVEVAAVQTVTEDTDDSSSRDDRLRLWIEQSNGSDREARAQAIWELKELGPEMPPEALRALILTMNRGGNWFRDMEVAEAFRCLGASVVPRLLDTLDDAEDDQTRVCTVKALGAIGPPAAAAVDLLIAILADKTCDNSPPATVPIADDAVPGIREEAAVALARIAANQPAVTNAFLAVLADEQDQVDLRAECAWSLGQVRPANDKVVAALIRSAQGERDADIRGQAIRALATIGPAAKAAIEPLVSILEDKSLNHGRSEFKMLRMFPFFATGLRESAAEALGSIAGDSPIAMDSLLATLADQQDKALVRGKCAHSLGRLHPPADKVVPALVLAVRSRDSCVRLSAASALVEYSPEAGSAVDALLAVLESPDAAVRRAAIDGVAKSCPQAKRALGPLVKAVSDSDREVREKAVPALSAFGPEIAIPFLVEAYKQEFEEAEKGLQRIGKPSVPALVLLLCDSDPIFRARAAESLADFRDVAAEALPVLCDVCHDSSPQVRRMAVRALGFIGVASPEVMQSLCQAIEDRDTAVRAEAASSLYSLVRQVTPPTSVVLSALKETNPSLLYWLIATVDVGKMTDERIRPLLQKHLDHPKENVRESAVRALRIFGPTAIAAVPRIVEMAADGSNREKLSALRTLAELGASRDQAERLLAELFHERTSQEGSYPGDLAVEAMLHVLVPHPDLAERFISQYPDVVSHMKVETALSLRRQQGAEFSNLKRAVFDHPDLRAEVILEIRDPRYIPVLKQQMEKAHSRRRSYLAAVARVLGDPPDRVVRISESDPGDFHPDTRGRFGGARRGHGHGFATFVVTGRIILEDGTPAPPPRFVQGNDRIQMAQQSCEPCPREYDPDTGRFFFQTAVFATYSLGPGGKLGPYMTGPVEVRIEAAGCEPLSVIFRDEMPDVEITLKKL